MNIITFLAIALFALMWICIVLQANRISNLEKGQDLQMKMSYTKLSSDIAMGA